MVHNIGLLEAHRSLHTCEKVDAELERRRRATAEDLRATALRLEAAAEEDKAAAAAVKVAEAEAKAALHHMWKDRRAVLAQKASAVVTFLQRASVADGQGPNVRDELLRLYQSSNRIHLTLYNEVASPTVKHTILHEDWAQLKRNYQRAQDLTGQIITLQGMPLDLRNPWDPPEDQGEAASGPDQS